MGDIKTNRKEYIDVMKGIGIILVVLGHTFSKGKLNQYIYLFHMPLFFFIAGYLFKPNPNINQFFKLKFTHIIIPYITFLILIYYLFCLPSLNGLTTKEILIVLFLRPIFLMSFLGNKYPLGGYLVVLWFPICLFLVQQIMNYILTRVRNQLDAISIGFLLTGYLIEFFFPKFHLPWGLLSVFGAFPIFYIGFKLKERNDANNLILMLLTIFVLIITFYSEKNSYDIAVGKLGIPIVTLISSIILVLFVKKISIEISKFKFLANPLIEFGKASMVIMYAHQALQISASRFIFDNDVFKFLFSLILSLVLYFILVRFTLSRALFLGSTKDLEICFNRKIY